MPEALGLERRPTAWSVLLLVACKVQRKGEGCRYYIEAPHLMIEAHLLNDGVTEFMW